MEQEQLLGDRVDMGGTRMIIGDREVDGGWGEFMEDK